MKSYANSKKLPKQNPVARCYRDVYSEPVDLWSIKDNQDTYYQITAYRKKDPSKTINSILYFRTNIYRCDFLNRDRMFESRLAFMPKSVAVKFAEEWYEPALDKCFKSKSNQKTAKQQCIKEFEMQINIPPDTKEASPYFLFTEDAIALNKLGIRTDKALVVDTYADFEKYMSKIRKPSSQPKK